MLRKQLDVKCIKILFEHIARTLLLRDVYAIVTTIR
jgi:hypothetical protein